MTWPTNIFYYNNMENELKSWHNKIFWVNIVWMQDFWVLLKLDSISWLKIVEMWHNLIHWPVVNTIFQEKNGSWHPRRWTQGNTKIGPVLEITTSYLHCKHVVEIRIWSLNGDNTHSWVRISQGSDKFVMDSNNSKVFWRSVWKTSVAPECEGFWIPTKGKSKTTKKRTCWLFTEYLSDERKELDWTRESFSFCVRSFEKK